MADELLGVYANLLNVIGTIVAILCILKLNFRDLATAGSVIRVSHPELEVFIQRRFALKGISIIILGLILSVIDVFVEINWGNKGNAFYSQFQHQVMVIGAVSTVICVFFLTFLFYWKKKEDACHQKILDQLEEILIRFRENKFDDLLKTENHAELEKRGTITRSDFIRVAR